MEIIIREFGIVGRVVENLPALAQRSVTCHRENGNNTISLVCPCRRRQYIKNYTRAIFLLRPILVATRSKALVYDRSFHRTACSNPAEGMDVLLLCVLSGLCDGLITPPGVST